MCGLGKALSAEEKGESPRPESGSEVQLFASGVGGPCRIIQSTDSGFQVGKCISRHVDLSSFKECVCVSLCFTASDPKSGG